MTIPAASSPDASIPAHDGTAHEHRAISPADEQAFHCACERLTLALATAAGGTGDNGVAEARLNLRALAVKLRDAGYWRSDKIGLRATVSLLWQADRFVSDQAFRTTDGKASAASGRQ